MKAINMDGSITEIQAQVERGEEDIRVSITEEYDFSKTDRIELDYCGAIAHSDDDGYIVLPRGVGCNDYTLFFFNRHGRDFHREIRGCDMPVFGVKTATRCFLAVVTGYSYDYTLRISCEEGEYRVFPVFEIHGEQPYEAPEITFFELTGEDADYSGMARRYRRYRCDRGELTPLFKRVKSRKELAYAADSVLIRVRCGWKPAPAQVLHQTLKNEPPMHVACDFDRVGDILDELKRQGVEKAEICLVGWNIKGHDGRWPQAFPVSEELGGEEKLRSLIRKAQRMGYQITCHTNSTDQYEIADCYNMENTRLDRYGKMVINDVSWSGGQMSQLCPEIACRQAREILPQVAELGFRGIHYIDVLSIVPPRKCYHNEHPVNSREAVSCAREIAELAGKLFGGFSSEGGCDFLVPGLDYGLYISFAEKPDELCDKRIPFWQLVYHGYVLSNPYTSTINPGFKNRREQLKLIEYGGRPSYYFYSAFMDNGNHWMGTTDAFCNTDEQLVESVKKIRVSYDEYSELKDLHTAFMEKHEEVTENVVEITYSNGVVIRVDYNQGSWTVIRQSGKGGVGQRCGKMSAE